MPGPTFADVTKSLLGPILIPLGNYIVDREFRKAEALIDALTRDDIYTYLDRGLRYGSLVYPSEAEAIFDSFAAEPTKERPDIPLWDQDCLRDYLLRSFAPSGHVEAFSPAAALEAAVPVLWRCLYFYAWYPFQNQNPYDDDDVIDRKAFGRAISILTGMQPRVGFEVNPEGTYFNTHGREAVMRARGTFRSLCLPHVQQLDGEKGPSNASRMPPKELACEEYGSPFGRIARGTRLGDVIETLRGATITRSSKFMTSEQYYEQAARELLLPQCEADESGLGLLPVEDLEKLLTLFLSLRFRGVGDMEITSPKDPEHDAVNGDVLAFTRAILDTLRERQSPEDANPAYITHDTWTGALPSTGNFHCALRRLWIALVRPQATINGQKEDAIASGERSVSNTVIQAMALCSMPCVLLDNTGKWPEKSQPAPLRSDLPNAGLVPRTLEVRLCDLQNSSLVYEASADQVSSEALMTHLCGDFDFRLVLIRGLTTNYSGSSSITEEIGKKAVFGIFLTAPLWTGNPSGQPQHWLADSVDCVFQLLPTFRIMPTRGLLDRFVTTSVLMDRLPGTAGLVGIIGEQMKDIQTQHCMNMATQALNEQDGNLDPDVVQQLERQIAEQDVIAVGAFGSKIPALTIDLQSKQVSFECNAAHPNKLFENPYNAKRRGMTAPRYYRNTEYGTPSMQRESFRADMQMEQIEVYKVPSRNSGAPLPNESDKYLSPDIAHFLLRRYEGANGIVKNNNGNLSSNEAPEEQAVSREELKKRIQGFGPRQDESSSE